MDESFDVGSDTGTPVEASADHPLPAETLGRRRVADFVNFADEVRRYAEQLRDFGRATGDPRVTGEMEIFKQTRQFVQHRKRVGYGKTLHLPE